MRERLTFISTIRLARNKRSEIRGCKPATPLIKRTLNLICSRCSSPEEAIRKCALLLNSIHKSSSLKMEFLKIEGDLCRNLPRVNQLEDSNY